MLKKLIIYVVLISRCISFLDASTGEAFYYHLSRKEDIWQIIHLLQPSEVVLSGEQKEKFF